MGDSLGIPPLDDNDDGPLAALSDPFATSQCCCFDKFSSCPDPRLRASSVSDLMNSSTTLETETTVSPTEGLLFSRMISPQKALECPDSMKTCCYDQELD